MDAQQLPPDTVCLGTVRAGTRLAQLPNGNLIAVHPEERPLLITPQGLVPIDIIDVPGDSTPALSTGYFTL